MTDTIRPKIDAIAPALTGAGNRTLTDVADAITALAGTGLSNSLSDLGVDIRATTFAVNQSATDLAALIDHLKAALGAAPYNDLELASVRGLLNAILSAIGSLRQDVSGLELTLSSSISALSDNVLNVGASVNASIDATANVLSGNIVSLSPSLINIDANLSNGGNVSNALAEVRDTVLATSGSIRNEIVGAITNQTAQLAGELQGRFAELRGDDGDTLTTIIQTLQGLDFTVRQQFAAQTAALLTALNNVKESATADSDILENRLSSIRGSVIAIEGDMAQANVYLQILANSVSEP